LKAFLISLLLFGCSTISKAQTNQIDFTSPVKTENSVIERTQAGVVQVFAAGSSGSGFFLDINGAIFAITNSHVIESSLQRPAPGQSRVVAPIRVRTAFGEEVRATVWKESQQHDIAILKLERIPATVVPLQLSTASPRKGMEVFLWGAPHGIGLVPLDGAIAAIAVNSDSNIFAGAPVNIILARISVAPGNSGGPLLDRQGKASLRRARTLPTTFIPASRSPSQPRNSPRRLWRSILVRRTHQGSLIQRPISHHHQQRVGIVGP
jgi:S1-C subfamily serine protease